MRFARLKLTDLAKNLMRACRRAALDVRYALHYRDHDSSQWYRIRSGTIVRWLFPVYRDKKKRLRSRDWYRVRYPFISEAEHLEINLDHAFCAAQVDGIALVFFMGMGDYFYSTPLIAAIKDRFRNTPIVALVSKNSSRNNSPLLYQLLAVNPHISDVKIYDGGPAKWLRYQEFPNSFKTYDYRNCLKCVPSRYLVVPMYYEHAPYVQHRQITLFETFSMVQPAEIPRPLIHLPSEPSRATVETFRLVENAHSLHQAEGVVFLQLDARSSRYTYPKTTELAKRLLDRGFIVVSASSIGIESARLIKIDIGSFSIIESIYLLRLIRDHLRSLYIISVASVFWSISSGMDIKNLGMQHFVDESMHCYWYDNIYVMSHHRYERIRRDRLFLANKSQYFVNAQGYACFSEEYVLHCFDLMIA